NGFRLWTLGFRHAAAFRPKPRAQSPKPGREAAKAAELLDFDLGADVFELFLDRCGFVLRNPFLDRLGSALHEIFRFLQTEAGDFADNLNDIDLIGTDFGER